MADNQEILNKLMSNYNDMQNQRIEDQKQMQQLTSVVASLVDKINKQPQAEPETTPALDITDETDMKTYNEYLTKEVLPNAMKEVMKPFADNLTQVSKKVEGFEGLVERQKAAQPHIRHLEANPELKILEPELEKVIEKYPEIGTEEAAAVAKVMAQKDKDRWAEVAPVLNPQSGIPPFLLQNPIFGGAQVSGDGRKAKAMSVEESVENAAADLHKQLGYDIPAPSYPKAPVTNQE